MLEQQGVLVESLMLVMFASVALAQASEGPPPQAVVRPRTVPAPAPEAPPEPPARPERPVPPAVARIGGWSEVDRRAQGAYQGGVALGVLGFGLEIVGASTFNRPMTFAGALSESVGAPIMAGSALRSRRAILEQGGRAPGTGAALAWSLWGGSLVANGLAASATSPGEQRAFALAGLGARVGSYIAAAVQHGDNQRARRRLGITAEALPAERERGLQVGVAPMAGGRAGLSLVVVER